MRHQRQGTPEIIGGLIFGPLFIGGPIFGSIVLWGVALGKDLSPFIIAGAIIGGGLGLIAGLATGSGGTIESGRHRRNGAGMVAFSISFMIAVIAVITAIARAII